MALTEYVYRVAATNEWGSSPYSNESSATPGGLPPPTGTLSPTVTITSPADQTPTNAAALAVQVAFTNTAGTVGTVILRRNGTEVGRTENSPGTRGGSATYNVPLAEVPEGEISFRAEASSGPVQTGLTGTSTVVRVTLDRSAPTLSASLSPPANANGWNNSDVTVHFDASDNGSGIGSVSPDATVTTEGAAQIVTGTATDRAGNSANTSATVNLDKTPPSISATVTPPPNTNGWNNSDVTVTFTATDGLSGVASVTSPVVFTNEAADQIITGTATDLAGNDEFIDTIISVDKTPPMLTGSPADGETVCSRRPPFVIEYGDVLSGVDFSSLQVLLDGTNIGANFQRLPRGAIFVPTNDLTVGQHLWQVFVSDVAGGSTVANATFVVDSNPECPSITALNISSGMTMPNVEAVWVQGKRGDTNTVVSFSVNFGAPQTFNSRWDQFGFLVPLEFGTNIVVVSGANPAGVTEEALIVVRSDRYRARLNAPASGDFVMNKAAMGYFANGQPQNAGGYVSALNDEGLPSESGIQSVSVNGVGCTLGITDGNGNVSFSTTNTVSVSTNFTSATVTVCYSNNVCYTIPLGVWEGYFIFERRVGVDNFSLVYMFGRIPGSPCNGVDEWRVPRFEPISRSTGEFNIYEGEECNTFLHGTASTADGSHCASAPDFDALVYDLHGPENTGCQARSQPSGRSLEFFVVSKEREFQLNDYNSDGVVDEELVSIRNIISLEGRTNEIVFMAPIYYGDNTRVIFTFEGVRYATTNALDLSQVKYDGHDPLVTDNANGQVGYLITVNGGQLYTINQGKFSWPSGYSATSATNVCPNCLPSPGASASRYTIQDQDWLTFSGFHNCRPQVEFVEVFKDGTSSAPADGLIVVKGEKLVLNAAIDCPSIPSSDIVWFYQQMTGDGSWTSWQSFNPPATGAQYLHTTTEAGIFRMKVVLFGSDETLLLRMDGSGLPDAVGVVDRAIQIAIRNEAKRNLGSTVYAYSANAPPIGPNKSKCNLFVAHKATDAGAPVPFINGGTMPPFYPPVANQWAGTLAGDPITNWSLLPVGTYPQPGFVVAFPRTPPATNSGHLGILDYDGIGIGAGKFNVNRNFNFFGSEPAKDGPTRLRKYIGN